MTLEMTDQYVTIESFRESIDFGAAYVADLADKVSKSDREVNLSDRIWHFAWFENAKQDIENGCLPRQYRSAVHIDTLPRLVSQWEPDAGYYWSGGFQCEVADVYMGIALLKPANVDYWAWIFPLQRWYHQSCDFYMGYHKEGFCPVCGQPSPHLLTPRMLCQWLRKYGYDEEYWSIDDFDYAKNQKIDIIDQHIFTPNDSTVMVYMIPGGSEGYYVHVERWTEKGTQRLMLGKFWDPQLAMEAVSRLTGLIYDMRGLI